MVLVRIVSGSDVGISSDSHAEEAIGCGGHPGPSCSLDAARGRLIQGQQKTTRVSPPPAPRGVSEDYLDAWTSRRQRAPRPDVPCEVSPRREHRGSGRPLPLVRGTGARGKFRSQPRQAVVHAGVARLADHDGSRGLEPLANLGPRGDPGCLLPGLIGSSGAVRGKGVANAGGNGGLFGGLKRSPMVSISCRSFLLACSPVPLIHTCPMAAAGTLTEYSQFVQELTDLQRVVAADVGKVSSPIVASVLDGLAAKRLRELVSVSELRGKGAFFTSKALGDLVSGPLRATLTTNSLVFDPAVGAGDLLLRCIGSLPRAEGESALDWSHRILGVDMEPSFVDAARARLWLAAARHSGMAAVPPAQAFANVRAGNGLDAAPLYRQATHVILNPPFPTSLRAYDCSWGTGRVNDAALFVEACLANCRPGTMIQAVLPDVLRSGSRYEAWRSMVERKGAIQRVHVHGRFDHWTDVDVFVLGLQTRTLSTRGEAHATWTPSPAEGMAVGDVFRVSVGAVVDNRDPAKGRWRPFAVARDLPVWAVVETPQRRRRFSGTLHSPPFVLVRRTSRGGDACRARASVVAEGPDVAVDNHLLVLEPRMGGLDTCKRAIQILQGDATSQWLDSRIRCRHLTVSAVSEIPWASAP